ncbi:nucleoside 2-deoxyribosyltransferase, partial [Methanospirillum sp.]|uniref:nucleoside 2-deoxyribosyltransferase n=1 Tax=Methanospirillum sp. TaxID=45200 RepID=UPI002D031963
MYLLVCPCIENPSLRAKGITHQKDLVAFREVLLRCKTFHIPVKMLPCAETLYLGRDHDPGYFLDRLDTQDFSDLISHLEKEVRKNWEIDGAPYAIIGVDSSPVCGVRYTWYGSHDDSPAKIPGRGFFLQRFSDVIAYDVYEAACWKVYLAAPLFSESECDYNRKIADILTGYALQVHLPQDCGDSEHSRDLSIQQKIFASNLRALDNADIIIAIIDGADADSGTSWEIGYAYAKRKKIISLRTDFRRVGVSEMVNL